MNPESFALNPTSLFLHFDPQTLKQVDLPFCGFFISKLLGKHNYLDELPSLDPALHKYSTPYIIHPTPYTLQPTPYTLHPKPYTSPSASTFLLGR